MKTFNHISTVLFVSIFLNIPNMVFATSTSSGALGGNAMVQAGQEVIDFLTGTGGAILITIGIIVGAIMIMFGGRGGSDSQGYKKLGQVIIGGSILVGAVGLVDFFFSGALI